MVETLRQVQRPVIAIMLTCLLAYLALRGNDAAITAAITAFGLLVGHLFGERAALKQPGIDMEDDRSTTTRNTTHTETFSSIREGTDADSALPPPVDPLSMPLR